MGSVRQWSSEEFNELMKKHKLSEPDKKEIKERAPKAAEEIVQGVKDGKIKDGSHIYNGVKKHLPSHGAQDLVAQQLTMWLVNNWEEILSGVIAKALKAALEFVGNMLASVDWWKVLAGIVGVLIVGGIVCLAPIAVAAAVTAGVTVGTILVCTAINPLLGLAVGGGIGLFGAVASHI